MMICRAAAVESALRELGNPDAPRSTFRLTADVDSNRVRTGAAQPQGIRRFSFPRFC
jgi:hypothetical protein